MPSDVLIPGAAVNLDGGGPAWTSPSSAIAYDGSFAEQDGPAPDGGDLLRVYQFSPSLPPGRTVLAVAVSLVAATESGTPGPSGGSSVVAAPELPGADGEGGGGGEADTAISVNISLDGNVLSAVQGIVYPGGVPTIFVLANGLWGYPFLSTDDIGPSFSIFLQTAVPHDAEARQIDSVSVEVMYTAAGEAQARMANEQQRQVCLAGKESTAGTEASGFTQLRAMSFNISDDPSNQTHRPMGENLESDMIRNRRITRGTIEGFATYDELPLLLQGRVGAASSVQVNASPLVYDHTMTHRNFETAVLPSFSFEKGHWSTRFKQALYGIVNSFGLRQEGEALAVDGAFFARPYSEGAGSGMTVGAATVQTLTITGSKSFKLRYRGQETSALSEASDAAAIQTALRALGLIASSTQLTVTGTGPFVITFGNAYNGPFAGVPQPLLEVVSVSGAGSAVVALTTAGGFTRYPLQYITPDHIKVFIADTYDGLAAGEVVDTFRVGVDFGECRVPKHVLNAAFGKGFKEPMMSEDERISISLSAEVGSATGDLITNANTNAIRYARLLWTGPAIGAFAHELEITTPFKTEAPGDESGMEGAIVQAFSLKSVYDYDAGRGMIVRFRNGVASY